MKPLRSFWLLLSLFMVVFAAAVAAAYASEALILKVEKKYGPFAKERFIYLNKELEKLKNASDMEKLTAVNDFYNNVKYRSDLKLYHKKDYWATPWEFLAKDQGDCEDYVIAKYFALRYLGIDSRKLYFTYVRSSRFRSAHMVLTYFKTPSSEPLVLDNTNFKIFPASKRTDLTPIYNFNGESIYRAARKGQGKEVQSIKVHKKWDTLLQNIKRNKI